MLSKTSEDYISNRAWLRDVISGEDVILRQVSALEYLQLFVGYTHEKEIDVYARKIGIYDNINYCIVDNFDGIDFIRHGNVLCASVNQTINDMLADFENTDEQALVEALSKYYYSHGKNFDGLIIKAGNLEKFEHIKGFSIEYYCEG